MNLCRGLLGLVLSADFTGAFPVQERMTSKRISSRTRLYSIEQGQYSLLPMERNTQREIMDFQGWAGQCGVQAENGFFLASDLVDGTEDYFAATNSGGSRGSRVLFVPGEMVLSANAIGGEYQGYIDGCLGFLSERGYEKVYAQFVIFLKVLVEYEQGVNSPYYPWMAALPRAWNTAVSMDVFCMNCLPPYLKYLCQKERKQYQAFKEALKKFDHLSPDTKRNEDVLRFAYNVVFTRAFPTPDGDYRLAPTADFFNHDYLDNVELTYDEFGNCEVYLKDDVQPGSALTLSYGDSTLESTNPSKLLAKYGFLNDENTPATYCKIFFKKPSEELKAIGYDPARMLFYKDGGISEEVWDAMLYSRLEKKRDQENVKNAFYQAHISGDQQTKMEIHNQFQEQTTKALLRHVEHIYIEVHELTVKMNRFDSSKHPRLPLLLRHHQMVLATFEKVKDNLERMLGYK